MAATSKEHTVAADFTPPALATRSSEAELGRLAADAQNNPLFQALLDWLGGLVLVLNRHRQVVLAGEDVAQALGVASADELVGARLGEAIGCLHSTQGPGGCGTTPACRYCGALNAILRSQRGDEPIDSECRISILEEGQEQTLKFRVRASAARDTDTLFTVLVLERAADPKDRSGVATVLDQTADWPAGVDSYARIRKLGAGGMGSVFLVEASDQRRYALKTIRSDIASEEEVTDRFLKEIRLSIVLDHPNIVRTLRADQTAGGSLYMVTEYCSRGTVAQWLQGHGPLPVDLALHWLIGAARALQYVWREHRLVHRDIKPDNLLVSSTNEVKIADFGVAKRFLRTDSKLTTPGMIVGTVQYMAPEQAVGTEELDVRCDLYALGATFFELLSGRPPLDGPNPMALLSLKLMQAAPPLATLRPDLPTELAECINWLLALKPNARPANPGQLLERLNGIAEHIDIDPESMAAKYEYDAGTVARAN